MTDAAAPSTALSNQEQLANRLDCRSRGLRRQAYLILATIILVLIAGGVAFVFANRIVTLDLKSHAASDQYALASAAAKRADDEIKDTSERINEIRDTSSIVKPFEEKFQDIRNNLITMEDNELSTCDNTTTTIRNGDVNQNYVTNPQGAPERIGEVLIRLPMRNVYFSDSESATRCGAKFFTHVQEIKALFRRIQDLQREKDDKLREFANSKQSEVAPYEKKLQNLGRSGTN